MNGSDKVIVDDRAWIGWHKLPPNVQTDILTTLDHLASQPPERWSSSRVERWPFEDNLYVLHAWVGVEELLVFFYGKQGFIHIDSMLLKEAVDRYARRS